MELYARHGDLVIEKLATRIPFRDRTGAKIEFLHDDGDWRLFDPRGLEFDSVLTS